MCQLESVRLAINEQLTSAGEEILCVLEKQRDVCVELNVRVFVSERLSLAAELMFNLFQREIETLETLLERRNKLLDDILQPRVTLHRAELSPGHEERRPCLVKEEPQLPQIKEEQEEEADVSTLPSLHTEERCSTLSDVSTQTVPHMVVEPQKRGRPRKYPVCLPSPVVQRVVMEPEKHKRECAGPLPEEPEEEEEGAGRGKEREDEMGGEDEERIGRQYDSNPTWHPDFLHSPVCEGDLIREEPEPPLIKGDQEEILQRPEEADGSTITSLEMICEDDDDDDDIETEPVASTSTECMKTRADVKDCGQSQATSEDQVLSSHCSESDTEDSDEWEPREEFDTEDGGRCDTREDQSAGKPLKSHETRNVEGQRLSLSNRMSQDLTSKQTHPLMSHKGRKVGQRLCTYCGKVLKGHLNRHMMIHTGERPFICTVCGKGWSRNDDLKKHLRSHTDFLHSPVCEGDLSPLQLERSLSLVQEEPEPPVIKEELLKSPEEADGSTITLLEMMCDDENIETEPVASTSTEHMKTQADVEDCGQSQHTSEGRVLLSHCSESHTEESYEYEPGKESDNEDSDEGETREDQSAQNVEGQMLSQDLTSCKQTHSIIGHKGETHVNCTACLLYRDQLKLHMRTHRGERPFACTYCGRGFDQKGHLKRHMMIHTGEKPFNCTVCGKAWSRMGDLKTHMRTHTREKTFICRVCGKGWNNPNLLKAHMMSHTGEKPFTCEVCGKGFTQNGALNMHMRTHTGEKRFTCNICGKGCGKMNHLKSHMRTHTGEKPFTCEVCGLCFSATSNLKKHVRRIHTGEKTVTCSVCGKGFSEKSDLKKHVLTHTGEKPFACTVCGQRFSNKYTLKRHSRTHIGSKTL